MCVKIAPPCVTTCPRCFVSLMHTVLKDYLADPKELSDERWAHIMWAMAPENNRLDPALVDPKNRRRAFDVLAGQLRYSIQMYHRQPIVDELQVLSRGSWGA